MPLDFKVVFIGPPAVERMVVEVVSVISEQSHESLVTGPLTQYRFSSCAGVNFCTFGEPYAGLNLTEGPVISFNCHNFLEMIDSAKAVIIEHGFTPREGDGPPPVEAKMTIVSIVEYPHLRFAFHNLG